MRRPWEQQASANLAILKLIETWLDANGITNDVPGRAVEALVSEMHKLFIDFKKR